MGSANVIGLCPQCGDGVRADEDCVWTCPRDLPTDNPYWEPSQVTPEQQERDQVFSLCYEDHGGWCGDHMPLHAACYAACDDRGTCPVCGEATVGDERTGVCHAGQWEIRAVDVACRCARDKEGQGR